MNPEVVQSTAYDSQFPASSVLILGEEEAVLANGWQFNFWMARQRQTTGQGFTVKVDSCARMIAGFQIKNKGKGSYDRYTTREFKISAAKYENGPWKKMVQDELVDTSRKVAPLLNFTFEQPVELLYLRFDLISYWEDADWAPCGGCGTALEYFAPIPVTSEYKQNMSKDYNNRTIILPS